MEVKLIVGCMLFIFFPGCLKRCMIGVVQRTIQGLKFKIIKLVRTVGIIHIIYISESFHLMIKVDLKD